MKFSINWLKEFVELPKNQKELTDGLTSAGHMLDKVTKSGEGAVLDLELRGNRADCYSIYGIAREIHAIFSKKLKPLETINLKSIPPKHVKASSDLVNRAATIEIHNVKIEKSPNWLAGRLQESGIDSVNNIVDLTNYVMLEVGEPMHAFDLDKVGSGLEIRLAKEGEKITTFAGTTLELGKGDLVWAKEDQILSVAGAIGEKYNSVSDSTKNILLEAASYDRANIRKTVYRHNLLTEAGIRHEKDLDPNLVSLAFARFLYLLKKNGWGRFDDEIHDYYPKKRAAKTIELSLDYLNHLGGLEISTNTTKDILQRLEFKLAKSTKNSLTCTVPTFRTDVNSQEDIIEEVLRIYGYDKIPTDTLALEIPKNITPAYIDQEIILRNAAVSIGFDEVISSSFIEAGHSEYNVYPDDLAHKIVTLVNPPSPDFADMRLTLFPNLYANAQKALNEREELVELFEIGKIYSKHKGNFLEERKIGFIYYQQNSKGFASLKGKIDGFFMSVGLPIPTYSNAPKNIPLSNSFVLIINGKQIGFGGAKNNMYYIEVDLDKILGQERAYKVALWPKYPPQIEDHTFIFPSKTKIGDVQNSIYSISKLINRVELVNTYENSYTFRIWYQDPKKTLTDAEVEKVRKQILASIKSKFGGTVKE